MPAEDTPAPPRDPLEAALDAAAALAGLSLAPEHRPGVRTHLASGLAIAGRIGAAGREAAPVFRP